MSPARQSLPAYLLPFTVEQDYDRYTPQDHAAWRHIMRQNREFFKKHAVSIYQEGLKKTGIPIDRIPRISEMNECLSQFGWGAVAVRGFIPPLVFLDFQARGVLPIACDMRTVGHLAYTPAPDIVHEAAGHAPIIAEPLYASYLHQYAQMARRAIFNTDDIRQYEAIRYLSDIKENPDTPQAEIEKAEAKLKAVSEAITTVSEAAKVIRMSWWTNEYGLVGKMDNPKIYGAGLLSSVGESQACLSDKVKKIPLSKHCVDTSYNITEPQPQLFVAQNLQHLVDVLQELEVTLAYKLGGERALQIAQEAGTVNTVEFKSGLQFSAIVESFTWKETTREGSLILKGPVQVAIHAQQLDHLTTSDLPKGARLHLGQWEAGALGRLKIGSPGQVTLSSGVKVEGQVQHIYTSHSQPVLAVFSGGQATLQSRVIDDFQDGVLLLPVECDIASVFGGPADLATFGKIQIGEMASSPARTSPYTAEELEVFDLYRQIRSLREGGHSSIENLEQLAGQVQSKHRKEWLVSLELLELLAQHHQKRASEFAWSKLLGENLDAVCKKVDPGLCEIIQKGRSLVSVTD